MHHSSTIKVGYQSVVHCHVIRQTCTVVKMDKEFLRSGDKGIIRFRFMKKPEIMHEGDTILFREGRTRGKGKIIKIFPIDIEALNKEKQNKKNAKKRTQDKNNETQNTNNINNNGNNINININTNTNNKKWKKKNFKWIDKNNNQNNIKKEDKKEPSKKNEG